MSSTMENIEKEVDKQPEYTERISSDPYIIITYNNVNCYLVKDGNEFILIDTGFSKSRSLIENDLKNAGCKLGNLRLIVVTHGDADHTGNCAYFREKYHSKIAMHNDDRGMAEYGDFLWNRQVSLFTRILFKVIIRIFRLKLTKSDRFKPDILIQDGDDLSEHGFSNAKVVHLPGHSQGSVGYLLDNGDLFCGDLLMNNNEPAKFSMIVDHDAFHSSIEKLKELNINMVYPGHGKPFPMGEFLKKDHQKN